MDVPITLDRSGQNVDLGAPVPLFQTHLVSNVQARSQYVVSPDGQQFLMNVKSSQDTPPVSLIFNWKPKQ